MSFVSQRWTVTVGPSLPPQGPGRRRTGGFGAFFRPNGPALNDTSVSRLPSLETLCACASGRSYAMCCRRFHTESSTPSVAQDLLRSRYSAYAYRLPAYIMRTTHESSAERDRVKWRSEIMDFATEYRFVGGYVRRLNLQLTWPLRFLSRWLTI
jgi:hypothetical protein